jgi:hypothetical protein
MEYLPLAGVTVALILVIYLGTKKKFKKDESKVQTIKKSVLLTILVNSLIFTPFILIKMNGSLLDIAFFWMINFIIPYLGFKRLFDENN